MGASLDSSVNLFIREKFILLRGEHFFLDRKIFIYDKKTEVGL